MDIRYLQRLFDKRKWLILIVVAVAAVATYLVSLQLPDQYEAETLLGTGLLTTELASVVDDTESFQNLQFEAESQINTVIEMIRSNQVINLLSYRLILHDLKESDPFRSLENLQKLYTPEELAAAENLYQTKLDSIQPLVVPGESGNVHVEILKAVGYDVGSILNNLDIRRDRDTDLISVKFRTTNPYLAAYVVNSLSEEFIRFNETVKIKRVRNAIGFYTKLAIEKKQELNEIISSQEDFVNYMSSGITASQARELVLQKRTLENIKTEEESRVRALERTLTSINQNLEEQNTYQPPIMDQRLLSLRQYIASYNRKLVNAITQNQGFATIADSLSLLRNQLDRRLINSALVSFTSSGNKNQRLLELKRDRELALASSRQILGVLDTELDNIRNVLVQRQTDVETLQLQNEQIQTAREEYLKVLEQLNAARYTELDENSNISQVEFAQPPDQPVPARRWIIVGLAALLSLSLCVITLITLEILDISIKTASQLERLTGLPVIGNLNFLRTEKLDLVSLFNDTTQDYHLETYKHLMRKVRFEIVSSDAKTFIFTSTKSGSGKTSLLLSIGYSISLNHKRVLLIDSNFKNNQLTRICSANPTLERYIVGEIPMSNLISPSGLEGVDVIGSEGGNYTPSEILVPPEKFKDLLNTLSQEYDYIFLEGPSLNFYSDTQELIRYVNKVIPIFSAKSTIKQADKSSIRFLRQYEDKLMGAILNKVELEDLED